MNIEKKNVLITLFYMNECMHCKMFKEEWDILNEKIKNNNYDITKMNITSQSLESHEHSTKIKKEINGKPIQGYPTIKIDINDKQYEYKGPRTANKILEYLETNQIETNQIEENQTGGNNIDYRRKYKKYKHKYVNLLQRKKNK